MARPREFDTEVALKDAMNVFWRHGYTAASLPVLLKGMRLTRGSLYKGFVDKKTLFLKVLNRYETEAVDPAIALLTTGPTDGLTRIDTLFRSIVETVQNGDQRGCLLCSAAAGPAAVDADISQVVHSQLRKMRQAFFVALTESAAYVGVPDQDKSDMAGLLLSQYVGMRVLVRSNAPTETVQESYNAIAHVVCRQPI